MDFGNGNSESTTSAKANGAMGMEGRLATNADDATIRERQVV